LVSRSAGRPELKRAGGGVSAPRNHAHSWLFRREK
jgi:hypothetical protein